MNLGKRVYQHKKTGSKVITSEKLDPKHWKLVKEWKTGQMNPKKIKQK